MSAFRQAMSNMQSSPSGPNINIRGSAGAAPNARGINNALRSAGIGSRPARGQAGGDGMDVDGSTAGRPARGKQTRVARADPMSQANRTGGRTHQRRNSDSGPRGSLADRLGGPSGSTATGRGGTGGMVADQLLQRGRGSHRGGRNAGTPPMLRSKGKEEESKTKREQAGRVTEVFKTPEFEAWLKGRYKGGGAMDMSNLSNDPFLKEHNIEPIGSRAAATNIGILFWRLIQVKIQDVYEPIIHLSLANNHLSSLRQLERLPNILTHVSALDLSDNPIGSIHELTFLLAHSEKKGRATAGVGSLKSLRELKLTGCKFREDMLGKPEGAEHYKHEILRRFPGLKMLDGERLLRVVFPIDRQPKETYDQKTKERLSALPFTFPHDVNSSFEENEPLKAIAMSFCQKFFPLWDTSRQSLLSAYAPSATFTISTNPTPSRSLIATTVDATRHDRPRVAPFTAYVELPSRNFLRAATSIEVRMETLKSAAQPQELVRFWNKIPGSVHPLTDGSKWAFDSWLMDEWVEGGRTMASAMLVIQGEFQELDGSKCYRSFSRTMMLVTVAPDSPAAQAGWPCQILSDTLIIHPYLSNAQFGPNEALRSVRGNGVTIDPPNPNYVAASTLNTSTSNNANASTPSQSQDEAFKGLTPDDIQKAQQMMQATGMNAAWSVMCLQQNAGDYERALANFGEIRGTIPAEAFQA